jgi:hypothetical protein
MEFEIIPEHTQLLEKILTSLQNIERLVVKREKPVINREEAADYFGLSKHSIHSYTSKGVLPHYKLQGRRVYFSI